MINTQNSVKEILAKSPLLRSEIKAGNLGIVSAYYDTASGKVDFNGLENTII